MALCFALGSACFLVGPFPGYASLVGDSADSIAFYDLGIAIASVTGVMRTFTLVWSRNNQPTLYWSQP